MAEITKELGRIPVIRGEYQAGVTYYKDNIVQYKKSSYQVTATSITNTPPITGVDTLNPGWALFAGSLDAQATVDAIKTQETASLNAIEAKKVEGVNAVNAKKQEILAESDASEVSYSNTDSGLTATNVQDAVDELAETTTDLAQEVDELEKNVYGSISKTLTPSAGNNVVLDSIQLKQSDTFVLSLEFQNVLTASSYMIIYEGEELLNRQNVVSSGNRMGSSTPYSPDHDCDVRIVVEYNEYGENILNATIKFSDSITDSIEAINDELEAKVGGGVKANSTDIDGSAYDDTLATARKIADAKVVGDKITEINDTINGCEISLTEDKIIRRHYRVIPNGELSGDIGGYFYSIPIYVKSGYRIKTTTAVTQLSVVCTITEVDAAGTPIDVILVGSGISQIIDYTIDHDCYISISGDTDFISLFRIVKTGIYHRLDTIESGASAILLDGNTKTNRLTKYPLQYVMRDCGVGAIIRKWGFIGDSYVSGETPAKLNGELTNDVDMYPLSWGQQFMRIIGAEGYNFSNGGQTAKGWINNQGTAHDATYIGGVGGGDWRQCRMQDNLKQAYIISLGINDLYQMSRPSYLGAPYTIGDISTDVNLADYTQNNENTWAGCYAGIIQRIKSVQPKAKIFCITQFGDDIEPLNEVVRQMPSIFSNVYVLDFNRYGYDCTSTGIDGYMSYGHPTPFGYMYMAYMVNSYIDWIIRSNMADFKDVSLVGTDYHL